MRLAVNMLRVERVDGKEPVSSMAGLIHIAAGVPELSSVS
jgi:hypothetical protein